MLIGDKWKVLTAQLRDMEEKGLLTRRIYAEVPPGVEYTFEYLVRGFAAGRLVERGFLGTHRFSFRAFARKSDTWWNRLQAVPGFKAGPRPEIVSSFHYR